MAFNFGTQRPQVTQDFFTFGLTVPGVQPGIPISTVLDKSRLITSFVISNPTAGSSVYLGKFGVSSVAPNQGLEIQPGTSPNFRIDQGGRQLYEIQSLNGLIAQYIGCVMPTLEKIPFVCWDLTQIFLFSGNVAGSNVTIGAFPTMYL